jgi:IclR family acetate operon transcriptional repressor
MSDVGKTVEATSKSLEIVHLIKSEEGARLSDIARQLDISKSTVHSHLNTLRHHGYVTKEGEIYHLSLKFFHLGQYTKTRDERYRLVKQRTTELAEKLNHAVDFDVKVNGKIMTLFHEANESTEVGLEEGDYFHIHASATGKAILAELPEEQVTEIIDKNNLPKKTEHTITNPEKIRDEIEVTRKRGYAIIDQEWLEGLRSVAVAVLLPDGNPFGALSVGGPTYQLTKKEIESNIGPKLIQTADELSEDFKKVF